MKEKELPPNRHRLVGELRDSFAAISENPVPFRFTAQTAAGKETHGSHLLVSRSKIVEFGDVSLLLEDIQLISAAGVSGERCP